MNPKKSDFYALITDTAVLAAILAVIVGLVYTPSLSGPLVGDDIPNIIDNPGVRSLSPDCGASSGNALDPLSGRPLIRLSFALNYIAGKDSALGYHALNLAIHVFSVLVFFALVRLTLEKSPAMSERYGQTAVLTAFFAALLWGVHPLNTQAVSHVSGRLESLPGLFFLLCLLGVARGSFDEKPFWGNISAAAAFLLGIGSGGALLAAPLAAAAWQHLFAPKKFSESLARSTLFYAACLAGIAAWGLAHYFAVKPVETGFLKSPSAMEYAGWQPLAIARYIRLAVFPAGLVFDYWQPFKNSGEALICALGFGAASIAACYGLLKRKAWAFMLIAFSAPLAVSSSFFPNMEAALEPRMYLPLAVLCAFAAAGAWRLGLDRAEALARPLSIAALILVLILGAASFSRNMVYADSESLWRDTVEKCPDNPRAHCRLGAAMAEREDWEAAGAEFQKAISLENRYAPAHLGMGDLFSKRGRPREAVRHYRRAALVDTGYWRAYASLGAALCASGSWDEGVWNFSQAAAINPCDPEIASGLEKARQGMKAYMDSESSRLNAPGAHYRPNF